MIGSHFEPELAHLRPARSVTVIWMSDAMSRTIAARRRRVNAVQFWSWMTRYGDELLAAPGQTVADRVEAELRKVDRRIGVEVGGPAAETGVERREIILT